MNILTFSLKNNKTDSFNDLILEGSPFILKEYTYRFLLSPNSDYWRFGIRLSKTPKIDFVFSGDRHLTGNSEGYRDIHLSIGNKINNHWVNKNSFALAQYNFPANIIKDHLLSVENEYKERAEVEFNLAYNSDLKLIDVGYSAEGCSSWGTSIPIEEEYKYFKVFAWADDIEFDLSCVAEIQSKDYTDSTENTTTPFQIGNLTFRLGDLFDSYSENNGDYVLIPASSRGTVTNSIHERVMRLGIPLPPVANPGSLVIYSISTTSKFIYAGYAYSVDGKVSNETLIRNLCSKIAVKINGDCKKDKKKYTVSIPLFGSGAGGLPHEEIALIYDQVFNNDKSELKFLISIIDEHAFLNIKKILLGKYISLPHEQLQKPKQILELELLYNTVIDYSEFRTDQKKNIIGLSLSNLRLENCDFLESFPLLRNINFIRCEIGDVAYLPKLKKLLTLRFISTKVPNLSILQNINTLTVLSVDSCKILDFSFTSKFKKLLSLDLRNNNISDINFLSEITTLETINLSDNRISNILPIYKLKKLTRLVLSKNRITNIDGLTTLNKLIDLDVSYNQILNMDVILGIKNLHSLKVNSNPAINDNELKLDDNENHLPSIKGLLLRKLEEERFLITLPAKVLLLGNHGAGKSSLLHYLQEDNLNIVTSSTHIIKIEKYPKHTTVMPSAIFYDFGGQDYYHGIYRAFLSAGSVYLILWNEANNINKQRLDSNKVQTQDFSLHYWLCQKKYFEDEIDKSNAKDPALLIQTHSDKGSRISFNDTEKMHFYENEFFISLSKNALPATTDKDNVNEHALKYLKSSVIDLINRKKRYSHEPKWYIDFITYILQQTTISNSESKNVPNEILQYYNCPEADKIDYLQQDLVQLHKQGLILYYNNAELKNFVWLNPVAFVNYVHDFVLTKELKLEYGGRIPVEKLTIKDEVLKLLCFQKVIFLHEYGDKDQQEYIVPNFLPLVSEDPYFSIMSFDLQNIDFTLKFKYFIPFGLINQLICFFGNQKDKKKFWRDRLIFTFNNKARVLIHIDFIHLEIKVSCSFLKTISTSEIIDIKSYLFYSIMALYWDSHKPLPYDLFIPFYKNCLKTELELTDYENHQYSSCKDIYTKEDCWPYDLYISIDNINYVNYIDLCKSKNSIMIKSKEVDESGNLIDTPKTLLIYPFQPFTIKELKKQRKIAISYSTKDLELVHKFREYLVPLHDDELIEDPFQCTQLEAGVEWDEEIQRKFNECDIVFFMVSEHLMATKYVKEIEIKNAIDRKEIDKSFKIVPIILTQYQWARTGKYNLAKYTALPFKSFPVTSFENQHDAWFCIGESIRTMIDRDLEPTNEEIVLSGVMKKIQEKYLSK